LKKTSFATAFRRQEAAYSPTMFIQMDVAIVMWMHGAASKIAYFSTDASGSTILAPVDCIGSLYWHNPRAQLSRHRSIAILGA
jgi:hypothetical protein